MSSHTPDREVSVHILTFQKPLWCLTQQNGCVILISMNLVEIKNKVTPILQEYGIKKASVFGSFSREENRSDSDVDLLVELGKPLGLFAYSKLIRLMEESLGHRVDLVTNKSLNRFVRPYVLPELKIIYEG